jgi:hypothetical protein
VFIAHFQRRSTPQKFVFDGVLSRSRGLPDPFTKCLGLEYTWLLEALDTPVAMTGSGEVSFEGVHACFAGTLLPIQVLLISNTCNRPSSPAHEPTLSIINYINS